MNHEGIQMDYGKIMKNPGLRSLAKLMLNSMWGRFGMRSNKTQVEYITDPARYFDLLTSEAVEVKNISIVNPEIVEVHYCHTDDFIPAHPTTNVIIAAFTTAYARLKLYTVLEELGERVCYYDTDSIIYTTRTGQWEPPIGDYLGDLTDEIDGKHITTFVSGGPKNYVYQLNDGQTCCKVRGITLSYRNSMKINFSTIKNMVRGVGPDVITVTDPSKILRDSRTRNIFSRSQDKDYRMVYTKRVIVDNFNTLPYGY